MIHLTGEGLTIEQVVAVARGHEAVAPLSEDVQARMWASQRWVDAAVKGRTTIYGVNTGFGPLATTSIAPDETRKLSRNLILSCLAGVGDPIPADWVRAMILIRANSLAKGYSGVRPVVVDTLIEMLNRGVTPWVPSKGSLGASGDLAPLSHIAIVLTRDETEEVGRSGQRDVEGAADAQVDEQVGGVVELRQHRQAVVDGVLHREQPVDVGHGRGGGPQPIAQHVQPAHQRRILEPGGDVGGRIRRVDRGRRSQGT